MLFVAGEIFVWMAIAFVIGIGVGYAAHARRGARAARTTRRGFR